jgi:endoglucanase
MVFIFIPFSIYSADTDVRLNSLGFLPNNDKVATIRGACTNFYLLTSPGNVTVSTGTVTGPFSDGQTLENNLYKANFSTYSTNGTYYLNVPGIGKSANFIISPDVYNSPFVPVFKAMYLWRCGTAVSETYNGETFSHAACHLNDAYDTQVGGTGTKISALKGWHDAGDYNKYTVNAGLALGTLFLAWEQYGTKINSLTYGLPLTAAGYPEFLEELKWETDWLLTMQRSDGAVYDKVSEAAFDAFELPETNTVPRYFWGSSNVGTVETATFCAMMAMAARNFSPYDAPYATTCLNAATLAYTYLTLHLTNTNANLGACTTGDYSGADANEGRLWAAAEMWETTGTTTYLTDFETRAASYSAGYIDADFDWQHDKNLGMYTYLLSSRSGKSTTLVTNIQNNLITQANNVVTSRNSHPYGRPLGTNYYWGCNGATARQAMLLQIANQFSPNVSYINTVLDIIGYLFGRNTHDRSYVTDVGINPAMNPHHRPSIADTITDPWPGYLVGGSPGSNVGVGGDTIVGAMPSGLGAANYWADDHLSFSSNEVAINWQAALIYAMSGFLANPATPTYTPTSTWTSTATYTVTSGGPSFTPTYTFSATATSTFTPVSLNPVADCYSGVLTIDGNLNEAAWSTGTWIPVTRVVEGASPCPISALYKVKYNSTSMTIGVAVTDPVLFTGNTNWYNDDAVEIYIDANNNHSTTYGADDYQFSIRYGDPVVREENNKVKTTRALTYVTANGYSAEFDIAWADLGLTPAQGMQLGFDVAIDYRQEVSATRDGVLMWHGTGNDWTDTSGFGELTIGAPCSAATSTYSPTATYTTIPSTFTFTSTATNTVVPSTFTFTSTATNTAVPVTFTFTSTYTVPPTFTFTNTQTASNTVVPATATFTYTQTATYTNTAVPPTATNTVTTGGPSFTNTNTFVPTNTFTATDTSTTPPTFTPTVPVPPTSTYTSTATTADTFTLTYTSTSTYTSTATAANTFTYTNTATIPALPTFTYTSSATDTYTVTNTTTQTTIPTLTDSFTVTVVYTDTPTFTATATPAATEADKQVITNLSTAPNPISPAKSTQLKIYFNLTKSASEVKLRVYSTAFRLLNEFVIASNCKAGKNTGIISSSKLNNYANGTYYVVVTCEGNSKARSKLEKIIIIR